VDYVVGPESRNKAKPMLAESDHLNFTDRTADQLSRRCLLSATSISVRKALYILSMNDGIPGTKAEQVTPHEEIPRLITIRLDHQPRYS